MGKFTIYHNPRCSKSRSALDLLNGKKVDIEIIEYLKTPLTMEQLKALRAHFTLNDFVRTDEVIFKELGLSLDNEEQVLQAMLENPILMQRPIVTFKGRAIIGRPPELISELFQDFKSE